MFECVDQYESRINGARTSAAMAECAIQGFYPSAHTCIEVSAETQFDAGEMAALNKDFDRLMRKFEETRLTWRATHR